MISPKNKSFIDSIVPGAQLAHEIHGVPASVTIAQAILESSWGNSGLTKDAFNLFGIKASKGWAGGVIMKNTAEYVGGKRIIVQAPFRRYDSLAESIEDHAVFLVKNKRYAEAFKCKDGCSFATEVAKAGYATDMKYAELLISLIKQHHLDHFDLMA
ncbi:MAG: glycoside hydrolase family 73 protein [Methylococcaceae bacterium]